MPRLRLDVALTLLVLAALALAPLMGFGANHYLTLFARIMILAAAAVSLSFLVGGAGLASLGHAAAMGVGAYAVAILDAHRLTDITTVLPVAIAAAALFSLLTGAIAIRTEGVNFIMNSTARISSGPKIIFQCVVRLGSQVSSSTNKTAPRMAPESLPSPPRITMKINSPERCQLM